MTSRIFVGSFEHQLDDKGRVVLPAPFREHLAGGGYVAQGRAGLCLTVMTEDDYELEAQELIEMVRRRELDPDALRAFGANAAPIKPDAQGRIVLPPALRQYAGLQREVTVIGAINRIELWSRSTWDDVNRNGGDKLAALRG